MERWHRVYTLSSELECVDGNIYRWYRAIFTWSQCKHSEQDRMTEREREREDILSMVFTLTFECIWHLYSLTS